MKVKLAKTCTQIVGKKQEPAAATAVEIVAMAKTYKYVCANAKAGCGQRFKTKSGMRIHCSTCNFGYATTEKSGR